MDSRFPRIQLLLLIILFLGIVPYFVGLGSSSLWDSNEAFYAETPREMLESNDLINPSFNYEPRFNKPPLSYWIVFGFYKCFGVSEAVERIPIALAAVVMIFTAFALSRRVFSFDAGLIAALSLAASPRFLMFSRRIMIDVYLAMFMSLALLFFLLGVDALNEDRPARRRLFFSLMYVSIGLGVLTKGPVALGLPALALIAILAVGRRPDILWKMLIPAGAAILLIVVLPWYVEVYRQHGFEYIESFLLKDNVSRYAGVAWGPSRGLWFYLRVLGGDLFPWSLFLLAGALLPLLRRIQTVNNPRSHIEMYRPDRFGMLTLIAWIVVIAAFFSLSKSKEDLYILPVYPACAALVGGLISRARSRWFKSNVHFVSPFAFTAGLMLAAGGAGLLYAWSKTTAEYRFAGANLIGMVAAAGGIAIIALVIIGKRQLAIAAIAATVIAANWVFVLRTLPDFERFKPVRPICEIIERNTAPDAQIGYYGLPSPSMVFYLRRSIFELGDDEADRKRFKASLLSPHPAFFLIPEAVYEEIKAAIPVRTYVLASRPAFQVKLRTILTGAEPPRILLISNRNGTRPN